MIYYWWSIQNKLGGHTVWYEIFAGVHFLRIGDFFCFAETNFCGYLSSLLGALLQEFGVRVRSTEECDMCP